MGFVVVDVDVLLQIMRLTLLDAKYLPQVKPRTSTTHHQNRKTARSNITKLSRQYSLCLSALDVTNM